MSDTAELEVRVARAADRDIVSTFFERTVYSAQPVGADRLVLAPPEDLDRRVVRREVEVYLGIIRRRHPGVGVCLAD